MPSYITPQREMRFVANELLNLPEHYASLPGCEETTDDIIEAVIDAASTFSEEVIAPLNQVGDQQGCRLEGDTVITPDGFKEAYKEYVDGGWPSLANDPDWGGQGLPDSLSIIVNESVGTANWSWSMYPLLSHGCTKTIETHGTDEQKQIYLPHLVNGNWTGTMCLTESHCGTDLGLLRTKATPQDDGSYEIKGTKIFISSGEHDMAENIVHIVLARLPDAPAGTKGISLFIVPKFLPDSDGNVADRNQVSCGSLEHKMGIHGNATCVMNFDGAKGFLIGEPNKGLSCMFTFMNSARLGTAMQGVAHAEWAFQNSLAYAKDRLQMRSLTGPKAPDQPADPIIVHPEVRKLLLTQKAFVEGNRALAYFTAMQVDISKHTTDEAAREHAEGLLAFLTPICKGFFTEVGFEAANHGLQVFGGHGFIAEWGMEQNVRDSRISLLYEGTTQIQALDLIGRKVLMTQGESLKRFTKIIHLFCKEHAGDKAMKPFVEPLAALNKEWGDLTMKIGMKAMKNKDDVGAASVDYLMYAGYVAVAFMWAKMAKAAQDHLANSDSERAFYEAKITTANFYYQRILPRTLSLKETMLSGADNLMDLDAEHFSF
jgi:alkylation response protein AidB-like acyl-CoA dehydrogenase